ncbi:MAG: ABC transporter ATP-binding protein [Limnochordia bacterium]|nr:ABC transporter ATP-binding protein [Limnochordia bacterium]NLO96326.1 ABC transporter ATP-binding protein [Bacillota bacterium]HAI52912.1 macrolide ABC transporter ATP-binding protein [Bacillota bacterium]HOB39448.1 ABC transporter ATP-binding protein [Limnochordia bacterium]HOK32150.1 ABC transporter ATP-binding protein [Limnochordia bacterium]
MIRLEGVAKEYYMGDVVVQALEGIDLEIQRGEFVSIMGPSGSGKSTLLNILGVLDQPSRGAYYLEGVDITQLRDGELAQIRNRHFGFIFQSYNLFPELTALENVMVPLMYAGRPRRERRERAEALLAQVGMAHRLKHLPTQLSGGEQQRVAIARALANNPTLLLADEPTGNLATDQGAEIMTLLQELNQQGTTVVIVTHDPAVSAYGRRLLRLRDGKIVSDGPLQEAALEA